MARQSTSNYVEIINKIKNVESRTLELLQFQVSVQHEILVNSDSVITFVGRASTFTRLLHIEVSEIRTCTEHGLLFDTATGESIKVFPCP